MTDNSPPPTEGAPRPQSVWQNWITLAGVIEAAGSLFAFLLLFALDLMGRGARNPYLGILCYVVAPGFLFFGAAVAVAGAWRERRLRSRGRAMRPPRLAIDLSRSRDRRILLWFSFGGSTFLLLTAIGSYQTFAYTESNQFCGEVCHSVMGPEYTAYHRSNHARVACVECHVGSGPAWYFKAKINGMQQLVDITTGRYPRPIPTPVRNLRPARETCERCHWPQKNSGSVEHISHRFLADKANTPYTTRLLVHVVGGDPAQGPVVGIHWHVNAANKVEYYATDPQRQVIVWVRKTDATGATTTYRTHDFKGEPDPERVRVMDCIDCHNRPSHRYESPNDAVDEALYLGRIDPALPEVKRTVVDLMTRAYATQGAAVASMSAALRARYGDAPRVQQSVAAVEAIYRANFFPEMKVDWSQYPDNIGHLDSSGCFRCHDGKHVADTGAKKMPATECDSCHTLLAQGAGAEFARVAPQGMAFKHPSTDIEGTGLLCADCHNGKNQDN